jgi:hypothetical protein
MHWLIFNTSSHPLVTKEWPEPTNHSGLTEPLNEDDVSFGVLDSGKKKSAPV